MYAASCSRAHWTTVYGVSTPLIAHELYTTMTSLGRRASRCAKLKFLDERKGMTIGRWYRGGGRAGGGFRSDTVRAGDAPMAEMPQGCQVKAYR
jgi:uncharacterized protein YodC (DUF2158 family)